MLCGSVLQVMTDESNDIKYLDLDKVLEICDFIPKKYEDVSAYMADHLNICVEGIMTHNVIKPVSNRFT